MSDEVLISPERPDSEGARSVLASHIAFVRSVTPPEHTFALELDGLMAPEIAFFGARLRGRIVGIGALKDLRDGTAEIKSMHVKAEARGRGVARAIVERLLRETGATGYRTVFLETGTQDAFAPARALYRSFGFVPCPPFGDYVVSESNAFMSRAVVGTRAPGDAGTRGRGAQPAPSRDG